MMPHYLVVLAVLALAMVALWSVVLSVAWVITKKNGRDWNA